MIEQIKELNAQQKISRSNHLHFHAAVFCFWFSIYIYAPLFSVYLESIGFSYAEVGIILGGYGISQILLRFPLGILSDMLLSVRKHLLIGGFVCAFASCLILIFFKDFWAVLFARLLTGITASMWVMATVLYSNYFTLEKATKAMGAMQCNTVATQFVCMTTSGYFIHVGGWDFPFWLGAIFSIMGIYFAWHIKEVEGQPFSRPHLHTGEYIKKTCSISGLKIVTFLSLVAHAILFITIFGFSPIIAESIGLKNTHVSWLMGAFFIPHALTSLGLTFLHLNRKNHKVTLIISFGLTAFFLACIPFAKSLVAISMYHAGLGLALGFIFPLLLGEVVKISPSHLKTSAMGFYQSFYAIGILIGPMIAGIIAEKSGVHEVFFMTAIMSLLSIGSIGFYQTK